MSFGLTHNCTLFRTLVGLTGLNTSFRILQFFPDVQKTSGMNVCFSVENLVCYVMRNAKYLSK